MDTAGPTEPLTQDLERRVSAEQGYWGETAYLCRHLPPFLVPIFVLSRSVDSFMRLMRAIVVGRGAQRQRKIQEEKNAEKNRLCTGLPDGLLLTTGTPISGDSRNRSIWAHSTNRWLGENL